MSDKAKRKIIRMFTPQDIKQIIQKRRGRFFLEKYTGYFVIVAHKKGDDEKLVIVAKPLECRSLFIVTQRHLHQTDPRKEDNYLEIDKLDQRLFR